jgi:hypothetical protein
MLDKKTTQLALQDLQALAELSKTKYWEVLSRVLDNRRERDKNSIIYLPEQKPIELATKKSFYRGRISAVKLIMDEVNDAGKNLDILTEKGEKER